jgi:hypothetical protein
MTLNFKPSPKPTTTIQPKPPQHPPVHSYDPGKNPMELVATPSGPMERWRADALLLGETSAAVQARHDAVTTLDDLEQQKRDHAAGQAALAIERATFDAERRAFADQAATLSGRLSVEWDRFQKDQSRSRARTGRTPQHITTRVESGTGAIAGTGRRCARRTIRNPC